MRLEQWLYTIPIKLRSLFRRRRVEDELAEELRFHLEQRAERGIAAGITPEEAHLEALRAMQGLEQSKEACRDARGLNLLENLARDLRYAVRMLRKSPAFTAVAVLSLALGIGANTAIFSLINTLLLRPLPVPHPEQLRALFLSTTRERPQYSLTYPLFEALRNHNDIFSALFTWSDHQFQMRSGTDMVHVNGVLASGDYFPALGLPPQLGRFFTRVDDHLSGGKDGPVAVISDRFWSEHFQRSAQAIGSGVLLDRIRFTVIGVMPPDFFGAEVGTRPDIWVPLSFAPKVDNAACMTSRSCWWLVVMGRLKPGINDQQLEAGMKVISPRVLHDALPTDWALHDQKDFLQQRLFAADGANGWTFLRVQFAHPLTILMTLVGLVLLIACANLANLLLARASARNREIAVRLSLGAGRPRVVRQLLTESVLLSLVGGAIGTLFAFWLIRLLVGFITSQGGPMSYIQLEIQPDWRVVLFTAVVAGGAGLLFGLAPALRATRAGIAAALKESAQNLRRDRRSLFAQTLLPLQAALSVLLIAAAGLFAGSLFRLLNTNPGFNARDVQLISVDTDKRPEKGAALSVLYSRILERANALPGIRKASILWSTPLSGMGWNDVLVVPGRNDLSDEQRLTWINLIGPRFFDVMEIPLLAGRQFQASDTASSEKVGILGELAARRLFLGKNPVGEHVNFEKTSIRIVGVAGNIKYRSLRDPDFAELYIPYTQKQDNGTPSFTFALKTAPGAPGVYSTFRSALHEIAPDVPVGFMQSMQKQLDDSIGRERLMSSLSLFFGALALLLTSVGLYGALAYDVTRRTGEIGIRMALGASTGNVVRLILQETALFVAAGMGIGVLAVLAFSRLVANLLYGIEPNDPRNIVVAVLLLLAVAVTAALLPALRASRLDPTVSLRQE